MAHQSTSLGSNTKRSIGHDLNKAFLNDHEYEEYENYKKTKTDTNTAQTDESQIISSARSIEHYTQILVSRGFQSYFFDPTQHTFRRVSDTIRDRSYFETVYVNGYVIALTTFSMIAAGTVESYNVSTNKWVTVDSLPRKLRSIAAVAVGTKIYVLGGIDLDTLEKSNSIYETEVLNDGTLSGWTLSPITLLSRRYRHSACITADNKIYIAGGIISNSNDKEDSFTSSVEIFDPVANTVTSGPPMKINRAIDTSLLTIDSDLYAIGGDIAMPTFDSTGSSPNGSIEKLNNMTKKWEIVTHFPIPRHGISVAHIGQVIYVYGGHTLTGLDDNYDPDVSTWDAYDLSTGIWLSSKRGNKDRLVPFDSFCGSACVVPGAPTG